jgi:flagellar export protein FliJ
VKRFRFRLETVLAARRAQEEAARSSLALAHGLLRVREEAHDSEWARYRGLRDSGAAPPQSWQELAARRGFEELAAGTLEMCRRRLAESGAEVEAAQEAWTEASRRVAVLERLAERQRGEWMLAFERYEAAEVMEGVTARWIRDRLEQETTGVRR